MFKKTEFRISSLEESNKYLEGELRRIRTNYYELLAKHETLLKYLGLYEHERKGIELRKIDGPEPSDGM